MPHLVAGPARTGQDGTDFGVEAGLAVLECGVERTFADGEAKQFEPPVADVVDEAQLHRQGDDVKAERRARLQPLGQWGQGRGAAAVPGLAVVAEIAPKRIAPSDFSSSHRPALRNTRNPDSDKEIAATVGEETTSSRLWSRVSHVQATRVISVAGDANSNPSSSPICQRRRAARFIPLGSRRITVSGNSEGVRRHIRAPVEDRLKTAQSTDMFLNTIRACAIIPVRAADRCSNISPHFASHIRCITRGYVSNSNLVRRHTREGVFNVARSIATVPFLKHLHITVRS